MKTAVIVSLIAMVIATSAFAKQIDASACSTKWKEHKASASYVDPGKGKRMDAWNEFRKTNCIKG